MEAQCAGIPVIANAVCGTPELVNNRNGGLLPADPTSEDVAEVIRAAVEHPDDWKRKREQTRLTWSHYSNAAVVYPRFASRVAMLAEESSWKTASPGRKATVNPDSAAPVSEAKTIE